MIAYRTAKPEEREAYIELANYALDSTRDAFAEGV